MSEIPGPVSQAKQRPMRCLLVDDEPALLRGLKRIIGQRRPEWQVYCTESASHAISLLEALHFDCVVTDLQMPEMSGLTFLDLVRERFPRCVRVVHSSQIETISTAQVSALCHTILCKPAEPGQVIATLDWALGLAPCLEQHRTCS